MLSKITIKILTFCRNSEIMDYGTALQIITDSAITNKSDLIAAFKAQNSMVIEEKRQAVARESELSTLVAAITEASGAAGESAVDRAKDAAAKIKALTKSLTAKSSEITTLSTERDTLKAAGLALTTKSTLQDIAAKTGANVSVLSKLIGDVTTVKISGDAVTIGDKSWAEWLKSDDVAPFVPALIPANKPGLQLPNIPVTKAADSDSKVVSLYDRIRPTPPKIGS